MNKQYMERMMFVKKLVVMIICVMLVIGIAACGAPNDGQLTRGEEAKVEAMIEDIAGDDVDVDVSDGGDSIKISTDEGNVVVEGSESGIPWPKDSLPESVPEFKGITVLGKIGTDSSVTISAEGFNTDNAQAYIAAMESAGWEIKMNMDTEGDHMISAEKGSEMLSFSWSEDDGSGVVMYAQQ